LIKNNYKVENLINFPGHWKIIKINYQSIIG
jgi:hypothetical protein